MPNPINVVPNTKVKICGELKHKNKAIVPHKNPTDKLANTVMMVNIFLNNK